MTAVRRPKILLWDVSFTIFVFGVWEICKQIFASLWLDVSAGSFVVGHSLILGSNQKLRKKACFEQICGFLVVSADYLQSAD